ncbi:MAG: ribosome-binding factor A [Spirochaetae bacterium HGW-Spirochaetae-1]|jgi:ribosome-binding factor A|nr:MAG: ribosome-binding factor A [Spirochaetae bacterium HGW-Spirochaetae-1]
MAYRKDKLEEMIRRLISELIIRELKDPRIGFTTITKVELNKDYSDAKVGVSVLGTPREIRKTLEGLRSASGFIQHYIGKNMRLRHVPKINFTLDSSIAEGVRMVGLIDNLEYSAEDGDDEELPESEE